jgi:hypothetical protein
MVGVGGGAREGGGGCARTLSGSRLTKHPPGGLHGAVRTFVLGGGGGGQGGGEMVLRV